MLFWLLKNVSHIYSFVRSFVCFRDNFIMSNCSKNCFELIAAHLLSLLFLSFLLSCSFPSLEVGTCLSTFHFISIYLSFLFNLSFFSLQSIFLFVSIYLSFRFNLSLFTLQFFPLWSVLFSLRTYITHSVSSLSLAPIHVNVYPSLCRSVFFYFFRFRLNTFMPSKSITTITYHCLSLSLLSSVST